MKRKPLTKVEPVAQGEPVTKPSGRIRYLVLLVLVVVPPIVYSNSLRNGFVYDDVRIIVTNENIRDWNSVFSQFTPYRYMRWISFALDYHLWELKPFGYHLTNLVLHIACTLLVYFFLSAASNNRFLAALAALLFSVHPALTETVDNVSNRNDLLATLFVLASVTLYARTRRSPASYCASLVCFILALLSKEAVAVAVPVLIVAFDCYFFREGGITALARQKVKYYVPYAAVVSFFAFLVLKLKDFALFERVSDVTDRMSDTAPVQGLTSAAVSGTWLRALATYLRLLFYPKDLSADYPFPSVSSVLSLPVVFSSLVVLVLVVLMVILYRRAREASYGLLWIMIMLIPVSNIVPLTPHFVAERYLYAPAVGFCLFLGVWIDKLRRDGTRIVASRYRTASAVVIAAVILSAYASLTVERNGDWKSNHTLWSKTLSQKPQSFVARANIGLEYQNRGMYDRAIGEYRRALQINPESALMHYNIGTCHAKMKRYDKAVGELEESIRINPDFVMAHYQLGTVSILQGSFDRGVSHLKKSIELSPRFGDAYYTLALAYRSRGMEDEARAAFRKAVGIDPKFGRPPYGL